MVLTTTPLSMTSGLRPPCCAETAAARPHGPPPTITRSASFAIRRLRLSGYTHRTCRQRAFHADDLISPRSDTDVGDLGFDQRLNAIKISTRLTRQISET